MRHVEWTTRSTDDLREIRTYLAENLSPDSATAIVRALVLATDRLLDHPRAGPALNFLDWRKWRAGRYPYVLSYRPADHGIEILRVRHAAEDWRPE